MSWDFPGWRKDRTERLSRVELPQSGGFLLELRTNMGISHVFVPYLEVWADAIGRAVAEATHSREHADDPVRVSLDVAHARDTDQPLPKE